MYSKQKNLSGLLFIIIVLTWTWGILAIPAFLGLEATNSITRITYALAGASPSVLALIWVFFSKDRTYRHSFLKRIISFRLIKPQGYAFILLFIPAVTMIAAVIDAASTGHPPDWSVLEAYAKDPWGLLLFAAFTLVFGPLAEEIGWRGFLLDRLETKGTFVYGIGIGIIWAIWHLPMFFIPGTYQNALLEQGVLPVCCFALSTIALSVILGNLVIRNHHSILAAILFHFTINFSGELIPLDTSGETIKTLIYIAAMFIILIFTKQKKCKA